MQWQSGVVQCSAVQCNGVVQCSGAVQCSAVEWSAMEQCNGAVQWSRVVVEQCVPCGVVECRSCSVAVEYRGAVDAWEHSLVEQFRGAVQYSAVQWCSGAVVLCRVVL